MKVKNHYRIDSYLLDRLKEIANTRKISINELISIAINCYKIELFKAKEKKKDLSIFIEEEEIEKVKAIAKEYNTKEITVLENIIEQFLNKKLL